MTAPIHGSPQALREFIAEMLNSARIQAELGVVYAEIGDDAGLSYAMRRHTAYLKAATETLKDLQKQRLEEARPNAGGDR